MRKWCSEFKNILIYNMIVYLSKRAFNIKLLKTLNHLLEKTVLVSDRLLRFSLFYTWCMFSWNRITNCVHRQRRISTWNKTKLFNLQKSEILKRSMILPTYNNISYLGVFRDEQNFQRLGTFIHIGAQPGWKMVCVFT